MNREIKFRAWNIFEKKYYYNVEQAYNYIVYGGNEDVIPAITFDSILDDTEQWITEQYTGLKDKHGVDIYEGDIVKATIQKKTFIDSVKWGDKRHGFCIKLDDGTGYMGKPKYYSLPISKHIEVIGNIHENPELIK